MDVDGIGNFRTPHLPPPQRLANVSMPEHLDSACRLQLANAPSVETLREGLAAVAASSVLREATAAAAAEAAIATRNALCLSSTLRDYGRGTAASTIRRKVAQMMAHASEFTKAKLIVQCVPV